MYCHKTCILWFNPFRIVNFKKDMDNVKWNMEKFKSLKAKNERKVYG